MREASTFLPTGNRKSEAASSDSEPESEWSRRDLVDRQVAGVRTLLDTLSRSSQFYQRKLHAALGSRLGELSTGFTLDRLQELPLTTKHELVEDQEQHPPYGSLLTEPLDHYVRLHRTSGTSGPPLRWLDTAASWEGFLDCWQAVLEACGVTPADRVFVAFSFGPFIGFWGAFEAAQRLGALTLSGGAQTTPQRLESMLAEQATVLVCTPTYALHLARVARTEGIDIASSAVRTLIHAGEPGASVENVHRRLVNDWNARVFDHAGATELGAWGFPANIPGAPFGEMGINEEHFIPEVIDPDSAKPLVPSARRAVGGELVLTSFRRHGSPLLRYRTGDLVQMLAPDHHCPYHRLEGGVLGRVDDMFVVRGVNIFPSAVENVVLGVPGVVDFLATVRDVDGLKELEIEIEPDAELGAEDRSALCSLVSRRLRDSASLRVPVTLADQRLPRYELKARRFRKEDSGTERSEV